MKGPLGAVYKYVRPSGRCPAGDFLDGCQTAMQTKFKGSFTALVRMGAKYELHDRFKPLHKEGKPLWEFKEHDHRLYCERTETSALSPELARPVRIVLLSGWVKDKRGKTREEAREIQSAKNLLTEMQQSLKGGRST